MQDLVRRKKIAPLGEMHMTAIQIISYILERPRDKLNNSQVRIRSSYRQSNMIKGVLLKSNFYYNCKLALNISYQNSFGKCPNMPKLFLFVSNILAAAFVDMSASAPCSLGLTVDGRALVSACSKQQQCREDFSNFDHKNLFHFL